MTDPSPQSIRDPMGPIPSPNSLMPGSRMLHAYTSLPSGLRWHRTGPPTLVGKTAGIRRPYRRTCTYLRARDHPIPNAAQDGIPSKSSGLIEARILH